jgi:hypothetical protein
VIEPSDEMRRAYVDAWDRWADPDEIMDARLVAVLAIVERDYEVVRKEPPPEPGTLAADIPLVESLRFAVPLFMLELLNRPDPAPTARGWIADGVPVIGGRGDGLLFRGRHETSRDLKRANAFQHLAKAVAAGAVLSGEMTIAGLTFRSNGTIERAKPDAPQWPALLERPVEVVELP